MVMLLTLLLYYNLRELCELTHAESKDRPYEFEGSALGMKRG